MLLSQVLNGSSMPELLTVHRSVPYLFSSRLTAVMREGCFRKGVQVWRSGGIDTSYVTERRQRHIICNGAEAATRHMLEK